jgi:hypothetical protein
MGQICRVPQGDASQTDAWLRPGPENANRFWRAATGLRLQDHPGKAKGLKANRLQPRITPWVQAYS